MAKSASRLPLPAPRWRRRTKGGPCGPPPSLRQSRSVADVLVYAGDPFGMIDERIAVALERMDHVIAQHYCGLHQEIGRESCRDRVWQSVTNSVVDGYFKKKTQIQRTIICREE